jgi:uncharacterized protein (UPF0335 family)
MATQAKPGNGFDKDKLKEYIKRVEAVEEEIASDTGTFMAGVKDLRKDIKEIYAEAKDNGIPMKSLKAEVKLRRLDRDKAKIVAGLEEEDRESLEMIQAALGDFASSPLGKATLARAS